MSAAATGRETPSSLVWDIWWMAPLPNGLVASVVEDGTWNVRSREASGRSGKAADVASAKQQALRFAKVAEATWSRVHMSQAAPGVFYVIEEKPAVGWPWSLMVERQFIEEEIGASLEDAKSAAEASWIARCLFKPESLRAPRGA